MKRTFPRARQKSIIKKYQKKARLSRNVDILIFLDYLLFLKRLAAEANIKVQEDRERTLKSYHVNAVFKNVLKSCKG
ncbi:centromere protein W-like [Stylophora pistillata]|uniref:Centromere protein W n=1 Tax=Stylophora pistillata TaxID=50429 RepID=A0A2B4SVT4_STYPI|nr:centromere protein W-like [Stylophora pistillata]PFX34784.1 Centromere protein W [Stylophora pistillata]